MEDRKENLFKYYTVNNVYSDNEKPQVYDNLREANVARNKVWNPDDKISLSFRGNEMAGELGEACNNIKKLERERLGMRGSRTTLDKLAVELADIVICADLIAMQTGIDLNKAIINKFNQTSDENNLPVKMKFKD